MATRIVVMRFNPEIDDGPHWQEFEVTTDDDATVLDALHVVKRTHDGTLTFRRSCGQGTCGSDAMMINGRNALACTTLLRDAGEEVVVEPLRALPVLKDLVVDMGPFFDQYQSVGPWLVNSVDAGYSERLQTPAERARFAGDTDCILCGACTAACPVSWTNGRFVGPAALLAAHRFVFDSRDEATSERLALVDHGDGVWRCRTAFSCTDTCPQGIDVTETILELRRTALLAE